MMSLPKQVSLVEVGPRDGLQNEKSAISTDTKIQLCTKLINTGVQRLEAAAFVSPKWVPQMADGSAVLAALAPTAASGSEIKLSALVPNIKGMEAALGSGVQEVVVFTAASEAFAQKNINCTVSESIERFKPVVQLAKDNGLHVRGSISCALGCPYQGDVPEQAAAEVAVRLSAIGVDEFDVADTIGVGTADQVKRVFEAAARAVGVDTLAGHFHDTYGQALTNVYAALQVGVSTFHSSVGGLGGCPYAKGATGNVATEDVTYLLNGLGIQTGIDLERLIDVGMWMSAQLGQPYQSRVGRALFAKRNA